MEREIEESNQEDKAIIEAANDDIDEAIEREASTGAGDSSKVIITEPGTVQAIDGKEYYNPSRIIAGSPEDVAAWHRENAAPGGSFADAYYKNQAELGRP